MPRTSFICQLDGLTELIEGDHARAAVLSVERKQKALELVKALMMVPEQNAGEAISLLQLRVSVEDFYDPYRDRDWTHEVVIGSIKSLKTAFLARRAGEFWRE